MFVARCPQCATDSDVEDDDRGHQVTCPDCGRPFKAEPRPVSTKKPSSTARRISGTTRWNDDSDYINDSAVPPRHWLDRDDDRGPDPLRIVRRELAWPAYGLIWTGWIGFLFLIVGGFLTAIVGYFDMNNPYVMSGSPILQLALGAIAGTLGSMYFVMIASGGGQMKRVRNRKQALTTAIMGMMTLVTCLLPCPFAFMVAGPGVWVLSPIALPTAGFGLWAIIVLNRKEVVTAFERRKRQE